MRAKTGHDRHRLRALGLRRPRFAFVAIENGHPVDYWAAHAAEDGVAEALLDRARPRPSGREQRLAGRPRRGSARRPPRPSSTSRPGALADDHAGRLLRDAVRDLRAERLERRRRLLAGEALERAGDRRTGCPSAAPPCAGRPRRPRSCSPSAAQLLDQPRGCPRRRTTRRSPRRARGRSPRTRRAPRASRRSAASTSPKWRARFCAVTQPTSGMLSPKRTRRNGIVCREASIAAIAFRAEISP